MKRWGRAVLGGVLPLGLGLVMLAGMPAGAAPLKLPGIVPGAVVTPEVTTFEEEKFEHVVRQKTDFSCGAASVTTILKYAYDRDVTRGQVLRGMLALSNPEEVRTKGFSMLDMKNYVQAHGFDGVGYKVSLDKLLEVKIPVVVLVDMQGYEHFVVLRRATPEHIFLADPALGNRTVAPATFKKEWNGIIFAIVGKGYVASNPLRDAAAQLDGARVTTAALLPTLTPLSNQLLLFTGANPAGRL